MLAEFPELRLAVSATTRPRRPGEAEGVHYYFISDDDFDRRLEAGEFLEHHEFPWGQRSGTLYSEIARVNDGGRICVLELETEGALRVSERVPNAYTVFITAPIGELERRLGERAPGHSGGVEERRRERATESSGEIEERLRVAQEQLQVAARFDRVIENDDLQRAVGELTELVRGLLVPAGTINRQ